MRKHYWYEPFIRRADNLLRDCFPALLPARPNPAALMSEADLDAAERRQSARLMRVNHSGEVCAQALYRGQAFAARAPELKRLLHQSAREEIDHLAWCRSRVQQLGGYTSYLNPLWYLGAFGLGVCAGLLGRGYSLGFLAETEKQVAQHLTGHLAVLPKKDAPSRRIVEQMRVEESQHEGTAREAGAAALPSPLPRLMRTCAKVMTGTAYWL